MIQDLRPMMATRTFPVLMASLLVEPAPERIHLALPSIAHMLGIHIPAAALNLKGAIDP